MKKLVNEENLGFEKLVEGLNSDTLGRSEYNISNGIYLHKISPAARKLLFQTSGLNGMMITALELRLGLNNGFQVIPWSEVGNYMQKNRPQLLTIGSKAMQKLRQTVAENSFTAEQLELLAG